MVLLFAAVTSPAAGRSPVPAPPASGPVVGGPAPATTGRTTLVRSRFLMGAPLVIEAGAPDPGRAIEAAFVEVARLEESLSNWRPASEVSRMNRDAGHGPVHLGHDLCDVVGRALGWARDSGGAFDPTVEPVVRSLGIRSEAGRRPDQPEPPAAGPGSAPVGWRGVRFDPATCTIAFAVDGMGIDLGGIGKGYALDAAAAVLRHAGATAARLDFGGQVLVFGSGPDAGGWRIGVADPRDRDRPALAIVLDAGSVATSGDGERRVTGPDGAPIGHHIDPDTGRPIAWDGSVSVRASDATDADALSTALFVMGPDRGLAWAAEHHLDVVYLAPADGGGLDRRAAGALFEPESPRTPRPGKPADQGVGRKTGNSTGDPQS